MISMLVLEAVAPMAPLLLAELVELAAEHGLGVSVGGTAIVLGIMAFHGRHVMSLFARLQTATYAAIGFLVLLAVGLATGVLEGIDFATLGELLGGLFDWLGGLLGGGS